MPFVIQRNEDRKFVAVAGSKSSYTTNIRNARLFTTRAAAEADCCGNETARDVLEFFGEG